MRLLSLAVVMAMNLPVAVQAKQGDSGYEGGISSGETSNKTMQYQEMCFITGEPLLFEGTLAIKKSAKQDSVTTTYTYSLKNNEKKALLTRTLNVSTKITKKANGQTVEETTLTGKPSEMVRIDSKVYTLSNYEYSRSNIIDPRPAINYFAGNTWGRKTYQSGTTTSEIIKVEATGSFYGYDQYWGTAEAQTINYVIQTEKTEAGSTESWGGTAAVTLSSTTAKQLKYMENEPQVISFEGGYVQNQFNSSIAEFAAQLPEFDSKGNATDHIVETSNTFKQESFPQQKRLPIHDLSHLRGHWAEEDIKAMYSLEIFKEDSTSFNPQEYITKAEFIAAMAEAAKEVPKDTDSSSKTPKLPTSSKGKKEEIVSPFTDLPVSHPYFSQIDNAYKRGIITGKGDGTFGMNEDLTMADAVTVFIKSIGLESLAPGPYPVTTFRDNDEIPEYARRAAYVAQRIGLVKGDSRGYLSPNQRLTKAQAAAMINRFIGYMREDIKKDYRDRIMSY